MAALEAEHTRKTACYVKKNRRRQGGAPAAAPAAAPKRPEATAATAAAPSDTAAAAPASATATAEASPAAAAAARAAASSDASTGGALMPTRENAKLLVTRKMSDMFTPEDDPNGEKQEYFGRVVRVNAEEWDGEVQISLTSPDLA